MAFTPNEGIYTELYDKLQLLPEDRERLRRDRGFTDKTIDTLGFKSAGNCNIPIITALKDKHGMGDCHACSIWDCGKDAPSWQFTKSGNILIPYLNTDDSVYLYKSHKDGCLRGACVAPYCNKTFSVKSDMVVLCESEFKAAAMYQMGYRALGLGGVSTFTGKHMPMLAALLKNIPRIIVLFDTEVQDDPSLSNFKESYKRRYAQYIWSYILAKKLHNYMTDECVQCDIRIASLPEAWMTDGKADIDSCVAAGHTAEEFSVVLKDALEPEVYRDWIKVAPQHKPWIMRRMQSAFRSNNVFEENNCLYAATVKGNETKIRAISNFKIGLLNTTRQGGKIFRDVQLVNEFGDRSKSFHMEASMFSNVNEFKKACLGSGDFMWKGNDMDFTNVVEALFLDTEANPIDVLDYAGRIEEKKMWVFSNIAILDDGTIINHKEDCDSFSDDDKIFRVHWQGSEASGRIRLSTNHVDMNDVIDKIKIAWGTPGIIALGYFISTLFSNVYFNKYHCFPVGLFYGEASSGKSTLADMLALMLGFPPDNPAMNISNTTQVAMSRKLAFYSSLPVRFDEHRQGDRKIEEKYSVMRSFYNRQGSSKGTRRGQTQISEVEVRGCCVIIGEQKPNDYALLTRCVPIYLSKCNNTQETLKAVNYLMNIGEDLSNITLQILKRYDELSKKFLVNCEDTRKGLSRIEGLNFRATQHFAAVLASLSLVMEPENFVQHRDRIIDTYVEYTVEQSNETVLMGFLEDIMTMKVSGENISPYIWFDQASFTVIVYLPGLYQEWAKWKRMRSNITTLVSFSTFSKYFSSQGFFYKRSKRSIRKSDSSQRVNIIELHADHRLPEIIRDILDMSNTGDNNENDSELNPPKPKEQPKDRDLFAV